MHRVAILTNILPPYRVPLFHELGTEFEVRVFLSGKEKNRTTWSEVVGGHGFSVSRLPGLTIRMRKRGSGGVFDYRHLHLNPTLLLALWRFDPDAIVTAELGFRTAAAIVYGSLFRVPVWVWWEGTPHTERRIGYGRRLWRRLLASRVKQWITPGKTSTSYLVSLGADSSQVVGIQNTVDEEAFRTVCGNFQFDGPRPVFLYLGALIARKGVDRLLRAARDLSLEGREFSLVVIGDGPDGKRLVAEATAIGLQNVTFLPAMDPSAVPRVMRGADFFILPTLEDVWGMVVIEALWVGTPVLCSQYAGAASEILPPSNVFDPTDIPDMVRIMRDAIDGLIPAADTSPLHTTKEVAAFLADEIGRAVCESGRSPR